MSERPCRVTIYKNYNNERKIYYDGDANFIIFFQEGNIQDGIDIGALVKLPNGEIHKIWDIEGDLKFENKEEAI